MTHSDNTSGRFSIAFVKIPLLTPWVIANFGEKPTIDTAYILGRIKQGGQGKNDYPSPHGFLWGGFGKEVIVIRDW